MKRRLNGYLLQCIIEKFGTQKAFIKQLMLKHGVRVHSSTASRVISYRENLMPEQQQQWADVLGQDVKTLFGK